MVTPNDEPFNTYKRTEAKALEIMKTLKGSTPRKPDIEVALLAAIFELHRGDTAPETVGAIIQGHLKTLIPYYAGKAPPARGR